MKSIGDRLFGYSEFAFGCLAFVFLSLFSSATSIILIMGMLSLIAFAPLLGHAPPHPPEWLRIPALLAVALLLTQLPHALKALRKSRGHTLTSRVLVHLGWGVLWAFILWSNWHSPQFRYVLAVGILLVCITAYEDVMSYLFYRRVKREGAPAVARSITDKLLARYPNDYDRVSAKLTQIADDMFQKTQFHRDFVVGPLHDERSRVLKKRDKLRLV